MSFASTLKENCTDGEIARFACCFLHTKDGQVDWDAASKQYDPNIKVASFKTVTMKALAKVRKSLPENGGGDGGDDKEISAPAKGGKKRKAATEEEGAVKKGKGRAEGRKKASAATVTAEGEASEGEAEGVGEGEAAAGDDEVPVKDETDGL